MYPTCLGGARLGPGPRLKRLPRSLNGNLDVGCVGLSHIRNHLLRGYKERRGVCYIAR
jgi:hypothetical protein